jgi:uncharacterized protein YkwD
MNLKYCPKKSAAIATLFLCVFAQNAFSQNIKAEKTGEVAAYITEKDIDSGIVRRRIANAETAKTTSKFKFTEDQLLDFEKQTFALINQERVEFGLQPIVWSDEVAKIARLHSENMAKYNFFSHTGIDGKMVNDRADLLGITKWTAIGENIAYNRGYQKPLECAVEKWMESPGHRENLLNDRWKESAIGIAVTANGTYYFTQVFLVRK